MNRQDEAVTIQNMSDTVSIDTKLPWPIPVQRTLQIIWQHAFNVGDLIVGIAIVRINEFWVVHQTAVTKVCPSPIVDNVEAPSDVVG